MRGLGSDIIEVDRIENAISKHGAPFLNRLFTLAEQEYCDRFKDAARHYAGRFAAKEAIVKALGTGFREGISWLDIEILNDAAGKPQVKLSPSAEALFGTRKFELTISHCKSYALAVAIHV